MELHYEPTIEDLCEPQVRFYLRSKTYRRQRFLEPIWGGVAASATIYFFAVFLGEVAFAWWGYLIIFALGWVGCFLLIRELVSIRIRGYVKREYGHKLPSTTKYLVTDSKLHCSSMGAEYVLDLKDLSSINEDSERLELSFGDVGLCTIPIRAFQDDCQKTAFLELLRKEHCAAPNGGGAAGDKNNVADSPPSVI